MSLSEIIIQKIKNEGPINFRDFMEMALYYPEYGYYMSPEEKIGVCGDYCTSPETIQVFGKILSRQLEEMWHLTGRGPFKIVEYGAGNGSLCAGILAALKDNPGFYEQLNYCIIEKSPALRNKQGSALPNDQVTWVNAIDDLENFTGCVLANEVADNFAVHQVVMQDDLMEVFVDYEKEFCEILKPASTGLRSYLEQLNINLPYGFRAEINLEALSWIKHIAAILEKGFLLMIDYGFSSSELCTDKRRNGTLLSYYKHSVNDHFYERIGRQDITAHVNFSAIKKAGLENGLQLAGLTSQAFFLRSLGLISCLKETETTNGHGYSGSAEMVMACRFMTTIANKLKVLILYKGLKPPLLTGLMFPLFLD